MKLVTVSLAVVWLVGCQRQPDPAFVVKSKPPQRREIIQAVMASHDVPLSVSPTCANVGTQPGDKTIGEYLSGFLSVLDAAEAKNSLETRVTEGRDPNGSAVWTCELTVRHSAGEDEWGWGVRFNVNHADGRVHRESFTCIGGG